MPPRLARFFAANRAQRLTAAKPVQGQIGGDNRGWEFGLIRQASSQLHWGLMQTGARMVALKSELQPKDTYNPCRGFLVCHTYTLNGAIPFLSASMSSNSPAARALTTERKCDRAAEMPELGSLRSNQGLCGLQGTTLECVSKGNGASGTTNGIWAISTPSEAAGEQEERRAREPIVGLL